MRRTAILLGCFLGAGVAQSWGGVGQETASAATEQEPAQRPQAWVERMRAQGNALELSVKDAIRLALLNNLEIEIENFNEELNQERILQTKGFYDPILSFRVGWLSSDTPTTSVLEAGTGISTSSFDQLTWNSSLQQNVPGGGTFTLSLNNRRSSTNSTFSFINPQFGSDFRVDFNQPLWRGFRKTSTERQLKIYNLDSRINDSQFKQRVAEIVQQVERQYWELVFAIENHEARRQSLELAIVQHENNQKRVQIGVMAPIEITSSRAEVATREQDMIRSEVEIIQAQNALKRLLASDPQSDLWNRTLIPTDRPQRQAVTISLEEAIRTALERRPELERLQLQLEQNEVDYDFYRKERKPRVDLVASFGSTGRSGLTFRSVPVDTDGDGVPDRTIRVPDPDNPSFGNFSQSLGQAFGFDFRNWQLAVQVEMPLRNRSNEGQLAQNRIRERQLLSQLKSLQQSILVEVRNAFETIATREKSLEAARLARQLSEEQLAGENKRFEAGLSTNFEVLRFQRDLAERKVQELRALIDYQQALTDLRKAIHTIVDENDIVVARRDEEGGGAG